MVLAGGQDLCPVFQHHTANRRIYWNVGRLKIKGTDVARLPGTWKVDVIVDYRKVLTEYFTITSPEAC
jgi:hypothetical protein